MAIRFRWVPSSLYTFPSLGLARDCRRHYAVEFPEFDTIPSAVSFPMAPTEVKCSTTELRALCFSLLRQTLGTRKNISTKVTTNKHRLHAACTDANQEHFGVDDQRVTGGIEFKKSLRCKHF